MLFIENSRTFQDVCQVFCRKMLWIFGNIWEHKKVNVKKIEVKLNFGGEKSQQDKGLKVSETTPLI